MAIRTTQSANSSRSSRSSTNRSHADARRQAKKRLRHMLLEQLEQRQLLAVGPQLIGIQPNNSDLITDGAVRAESPRELTFRFDDSQVIHPQSLDGIRITRSGGDGSFALSTLATDFGSQGGVEILLTSSALGQNPTLQVSRSNLGVDALPLVAGSGNNVTITLNSNSTTPTTARQLVDAINAAPSVLPILRAKINGGLDSTQLGLISPTYSPLQLQTTGDVVIQPGQVVIGDAPDDNEVTVRFAETLPNDLYRVEIFGFDDPVQGIVGLRNANTDGTPGELFIPTNSGTRKDTIDFRLDLGPQVTAVVPQPVVRNAAGGLVQQRDTIVVHFDGDKLLVENTPGGQPTAGSAENPEFYQLIFTDDTVRNTDDVRFLPLTAKYNASANTVTLKFDRDIDALAGSNAGPRTFRLRIGSRETEPFAPMASEAAATAISDFNTDGKVKFRFTARELGESGSGIQIRVINTNSGDPPLITAAGRVITVDLGTNTVIAADLLAALQSSSAATDLVSIEFEAGSIPTTVLNAPINYSPINVVGLGSSFDTATNLGVIGSSVTDLTSLLLSSAIDAQPFEFDLPGASDDPGHRELPASFDQHINDLFGADITAGITTVFYNFQRIYGSDASGPLETAITDKQKERVREALEIWSNHVGVQFIETPDQGITIATGSLSALGFGPNVVRTNSINLGVRIDPAFQSSLMVLEASRQWGDNYGEDYFRAALTGIGMLLGLERATDMPSGTLMALSTNFINAGNSNAQPADEPVFPGVIDVLHGEHLFRNDSNDIDLYKFEVAFDDADRVGLFVAETVAERQTNSSPLDTLLHLYKQNQASASSNLATGGGLNVKFDAVAPGLLGNNLQVFVTKSDRGPGAPVLVNTFDNLISVDLNSNVGSETTVQQFVDAVNADPAASRLVRLTLVSGAGTTLVGDRDITYSPVVLQGGNIEQIARNDDYFSEDSLIRQSLTAGTYYLGVSSSGNDEYNAVIEDTGLGGSTQGKYDLRITFRAQVDASDAIRDMEGSFVGDVAVPFDGDADGSPGGIYNFWFQTRPLNRLVEFTAGGDNSLEGKIITLTGANGVVRRFEFDSNGSVGIGNTPIAFSLSDTAGQLANTFANQIRSRPELGIAATANGVRLELVGERSIQLSPNLNIVSVQGRTIFVDKSAGPNADGSLAKPFNNIAGVGVPNAFAVAQPGDIVRIVGNGGGDGNVATIEDNLAYEIGFGLINGGPLSDGSTMEVPLGVTTMIDAGAIFKMRRSRIGVGSSSLGVDRSNGALQVLGTPALTDAAGNVLRAADGSAIPGSVYFTSWLDETIGEDTYLPQTLPAVGDWGGISYRNDIDSAAGRRNLEDEGIFLQYVNHADLRYGGGGNVVIDSVQQVVNPIQMIDMRPTVTFNRISNSADAAMSAAPNSFAETNFSEPRYQLNGAFTPDYDRVGPEIHHNTLINNSLNGLFVRVETPAGSVVQPLTLAARFNDIDIPHIVSENIIIAGTPGGAILDTTRPLANLISVQPVAGGTLLPGTYNYKVTFVDEAGYETPASNASGNVSLSTGQTAVQLLGLPIATTGFVARRIYRSNSSGTSQYSLVAEVDALSTSFLDLGQNAGGVLTRERPDLRAVTLIESAGGGTLSGTFNYKLVNVDAGGRESIASDASANLTVAANAAISLTNLPSAQPGFVGRNLYRSTAGGAYVLVAQLNVTDGSYVDTGTSLGTTLSPETSGTLRPRLDASLVIDPGTVVKFEGARIEIQQGATLLAEGTDDARIVFTSKLDDRFGAGGTFDTNNDATNTVPQARDWGGIYAASGSTLSIDYATIAYAGGVTKIEGTFKAFNPIEIQQAEARITNSTFEFNEDGIGGQGPRHRLGRLDNRAATIFVRGSQPILVGNTFRNNQGSAINIDANSINADLRVDYGRSTGQIDRQSLFDSNRGPLVRENRLDNNEINGMEVRGDLMMVESVWDDTDIVHVLFNSITVTNLHHEGGLRLQSAPDESLVVKLLGYGSNFSDTAGTGFTATGFTTNALDRVGGTIEIIGQPGFPVVLTSYHDDTVGAGLRPDGTPQTDTNNNGIASIPRAADWRSVLLDQNSNDRNVATVLEIENPNAIAPGFNSSAATAQLLGDLAANASNSNETLRLGFVVQGVLSEPTDVDVYSFTAEAGTEVWLDVDQTTQSLDMTLELLNANGDLLARSDNSSAETIDPSLVVRTAAINPSLVNPLNQAQGSFRTNASGTYKEDGSINPRDAGLRVVLPGAAGSRTTFHFRVRSSSTNIENFNAGLTKGSYEVQVRTRAEQEFPGSTVQYADIRYATNGVHLQGLPKHSPLLGEFQEDEASNSLSGNEFRDNDVNGFGGTAPVRAQYLGNVLSTDRATISVGGEIATAQDIDFYRFEVDYSSIGGATAPIVFDLDYADGLNRADTSLAVYQFIAGSPAGGFTPAIPDTYRLVYFAENSNIADDRGPRVNPNLNDFTRGSLGSNDPFIGAVDLPEGSYAVAVSSASRAPATLLGARREPLYNTLRQGLVGVANAGTDLVSQRFSLAGYSALDVPKLYFDNGAGAVRVQVRQVGGATTTLSGGFAGSQGIFDLSAFAGQADLEIVFQAIGGSGPISNLFVGFAERGERILNAGDGSAYGFAATPPGATLTGPYQLEIRLSEGTISDTNDRLADQITLIAPAGNQLSTGDSFTLSDAGAGLTFEFTSTGNVTPGNVSIPFSGTDSAAVIAQRILAAINDPGVQARINVQADTTGSSTTASGAGINLFGRASVVFSNAALNATNIVYHSGSGDQNTNRDQGQVLVQNNFIRHSRDYGVWTEPGQKLQDPKDLINNIDFAQGMGGTGRSTDAMSNIPALGGNSPGAVRNLRELNDDLLGGFNTGIVITNNVLESGGLGGVHIAGESPIWMISPRTQPGIRDGDTATGDSGTNSSANPIDHFGTLIDDRDLLVIDTGRTRVQFEFEDMAGAVTGGPTFGSGVVGGNGWDDTSVPIYYREDAGGQYLRAPNTAPGYSALEVMQSIRDSIFGSILMTNGTTQHVTATVAPSLLTPFGGTVDPLSSTGYINYFNRPALYLEGVSNINFVNRVAGGNPFDIRRVDVAETAQPFVRVVNNTVYGNDGRASFAGATTPSEPNDTISTAVETWQGTGHNPLAFNLDAEIGDSTQFGAPRARDVDIYKFKLDIGERALIDIDTDPLVSQLDAVIQIFDANGRPQTFSTTNATSTTISDNDAAPGEVGSLDPYVDFTATKAGVYFAAISAQGNSTYDAQSLGGRVTPNTSGAYNFNLQVLHPQDFVITVQDSSQYANGDTFTIFQVADLPGGGNSATFEFTTGGAVAAGNIPIQFDANYRAPDMAKAIEQAINRGLNNGPVLRNTQALPNGDFGDASPLDPVEARALGGISGVEGGLTLYPRRNDGIQPTHSAGGIGHDRTASGALSNTSRGDGTTERFVTVKNAAYIVGNGAILVDPDVTDNNNLDQLLPETGILVSAGASPTLMNNVFVNVQTPIVSEETRVTNPNNAFGNRNPAPFGSGSTNVHQKPGEVIIGGSVYQYAESAQASNRLGFGIEASPTNVPNTGLDFNFTLPAGQQVFVDAQASQFLPARGSRIIDSSLDSLEEREAFRTVKQAVGIGVSPVLAPSRDATGQLRVDDPSVAPPNGQGADVFKDRGALDRADFVGPSAETVRPLDNDALGTDRDEAVSVIQLSGGVYPEFRLQLVDGFELADPFPGIGIDDSTVVGQASGIRQPGAAVTLFENGQLLTEGIHYRFSYDATTNELIFTPLAGVWKNDRVYEIAINNKDRFVVVAPAGDQVSDGDMFTITDSTGGIVNFEFDSGYRLQVPQGLLLQVPLAGGATGGVADGDRFTITTAAGVATTFEFDRNGNFLAGNRPIVFVQGSSQNQIRDVVFTAIQAAGLPVTPQVLSDGRIFLGAEAGTRINTTFTAISQPATTLAIKIPTLGPRPGGITEGQTFTISDGRRTITFEYDLDGLVTSGNVALDFSSAATAADLAVVTQQALAISSLNITPTLVGPELIHIGLGPNGSADAGTSQLSIQGVARTLSDGQNFTITTALGSKTFEFTRDATVAPGNVAISVGLNESQDQIGDRVALAIANAGLGLTPNHLGDGNIAIGGSETDTINVTGAPGLSLFGSPGVLPNTRLQVFGPLLLTVPARGASDIIENSTFRITANGTTQTFEFDGDFSGPSALGNIVVRYTTLSTANDIATAIVGAINSAGLGINAFSSGGGQVNLGQLQASQVALNNSNLTTVRGVVGDGETFTINNGTISVTFEFDNADFNNGFSLGNSQILFSSSSTPDSVVQSMKAAIEGSILGLTANALPGGVLELNDTPRYSIDTTNSPTLVKSGVPGGSQAIAFFQDASFTGEDMKLAIISAINTANFTNLIASDRGADTFFVENAVFLSSELDSFFLRGVADLAGNLLKPNRINNETQFTILMPGVALDYGDAPDPFSTTLGRYPTAHINDGARHVVSSIANLGATITAEADGQPTPAADGDTDDGVTFGTNYQTFALFNRFVQTPIEVTLSSPGFVDGWIDFNSDGDWDDPGEQVLQSVEFKADSLTRTFMVTVPATAPVPLTATSTFARFRSSSIGSLTPTGLAVDGEVEDYVVTIVPGTPPQAVDDNYALDEDSSISTSDPDGTGSPGFLIDDGIAANDIDPEGGPLGVEQVTGPQHAAEFNLLSDGTFFYRPLPNFEGTDTFTYRVNDGVLNSNNIGTVTITVREVNDSPIAAGDSLSIDEDQVLDIPTSVVLANDAAGPANESGQVLTVTGVDGVSAQGGSVDLIGGRIIYTPQSNFSGVDTFKYTISDNGTTGGVAAPLSATATVTITVADKNDAPIIGADSRTTTEDTPLNVTASSLTSNDSVGPQNEIDDGQTLTFVRVLPDSTAGGTVTYSGGANGTVTYTPPADFAGTDTFFYEVRDDGRSGGIADPQSSIGTVTVTVTGVNDAPRIQSPLGTLTVNEDAPAPVVDLSTIFTDPDVITSGDRLTYTIVGNSRPGLVTPSITDDKLTLQLVADQNGQAIVVVRATDLAGETVQSTLTLNVTPVNDAPRLVASLPDLTVAEDQVLPGIPLSPTYFFDPDVILNGDVLTFAVVSNSNPLLVTPSISGGVLNLSLVSNQAGAAVITISATDTSGQTINDQFSLVVTPVNDVPVTNSDSYTVQQGTTLTTTDPRGLVGGTEDDGVLANDSDPEGAQLSAVLVRGPSNATAFALNPNGTFTYRHNGVSQTTDTFTYRAFDGAGQSVETTVTISISDPPPPPHQNPINRLDVNADGFVSPIDALLIINLINSFPSNDPIPVSALPAPPPYRDVDGNNIISGNDVLQVINFLNSRGGAGEGEGEGADGLLGGSIVASSTVPQGTFDSALGSGSELVGRSRDNARIGVRMIAGDALIGPALPPSQAVFAEVGASTGDSVDTSWVEGQDDESTEKPEDLALASLFDDLDAFGQA
ncbi:MAG: tandem-95 repeat protein [Pirellulaceae bacterium]